MAKYVIVFGISYLGLMTGVGYVSQAAGVRPPTSMNILILGLVATGVAILFIREQRRMFSGREYLHLLIGSAVIDLAIQFVSIVVSGSLAAVIADKLGGFLLIAFGHVLLLAVALRSWFVRSYARRVAGV